MPVDAPPDPQTASRERLIMDYPVRVSFAPLPPTPSTSDGQRSWVRAAEVHTGAMVALLPTDEDAKRLAVPDGEPVDQLHLTLRYLGKGADFGAPSRAHLVDLVRAYFTSFGPIVGDLFSLAIFNSSGDEPAVVGLIGGDDIARAHNAVEAAVEDYGADLPAPRKPFAAHVTLVFSGDASRVADLVDRVGPITFDRVRIAFSGEVVDIPLTGVGASGTRDFNPELHPHAPAGGPNGGEFVSKHGMAHAFADALNIRDRVGNLIGEGDRFEGSARVDGSDGVAAMVFVRERDGTPVMVMSTQRPEALASWTADNDDSSVPFIGTEQAVELVGALDRLISGIRRKPEQARTRKVMGDDWGNVWLRASTVDGQSGVDVSTLSYEIEDDRAYIKERAQERRDLIKDLRSSYDENDDPDSTLTPEEIERAVQAELADFDRETEGALKDSQARRDQHRVRFSLDQAEKLRDRLREFATQQSETSPRSHRTQERNFDPHQPRDPHSGEWVGDGVPDIDMGAVAKVKGFFADTYEQVSSHVDLKGVHFDMKVKGEQVHVDISPWDMAQLALVFVPGGEGIGALKLATLVGKALKEAKAAKMAAKVAAKLAKTAAHMSTVQRDFDPNQPRDPHSGEWMDNPVGPAVDAIKKGADKLKLAGKIKLSAGERLVSSDKIDTDYGVARLALTDTNGTPSLRLGLGGATFGSREDEAGPWRAGPDESTAINTERDKLHAEKMALEAVVGDFTEQQQARYDQLDDMDLNDVYPSGYTARLDADAAVRLRTALGDGLQRALHVKTQDDARWAEIERLEARDAALNEIRDPLVNKYIAAVGTPVKVPVPGAPPLTPEEDAELTRLTEEWVANYDRLDALKKAYQQNTDHYDESVTQGVIPGEWADVHYQVYYEEAEVHVELGAVPHGSGLDLNDLTGNESGASFGTVETQKLVSILDKMLADLAVTSPRSAPSYSSATELLTRAATAFDLDAGSQRDADFETLHPRNPHSGEFIGDGLPNSPIVEALKRLGGEGDGGVYFGDGDRYIDWSSVDDDGLRGFEIGDGTDVVDAHLDDEETHQLLTAATHTRLRDITPPDQHVLLDLLAPADDAVTFDDGSYFDWSMKSPDGSRSLEVGDSAGDGVRMDLTGDEFGKWVASLGLTLHIADSGQSARGLDETWERGKPDQPRYPKGTPKLGGKWMPSIAEALHKLAGLHDRKPVKVRSDIAGLKSVEDVNTRLRVDLRAALKRPVDVDLGKTNLPTAKEYAEGLLRSAERWPETRLDKVSVGPLPADAPSAWGVMHVQPKTGRVEILFDEASATNRTKALPKLRRGGANGRPGDNFAYPAASLFGAGVDAMTGHKGHHHVDVAVKSYLHDAGLDHGDPNQIQAGIRAQLGDHALRSRQAMVAEALADDALHGDGASPLSKRVREQVTTAYNATLEGKSMPVPPKLPDSNQQPAATDLPVIKKAAPKKVTAKAPFDVTTALVHLDAAGSHDDKRKVLQGHTIAQLKLIAVEQGHPVPASTKLKAGIIDHILATTSVATPEPQRPNADVVDGRMSAKPILPNNWGVLGGEIHYHPDGKIGTALRHMGTDRQLDVDGEPLANVVGRLATDGVRGRKSSQEVLDGLKTLRDRMPEGTKARQELTSAIKGLDAPARTVELPDGTPSPLRTLMEAFSGIPLARRNADEFGRPQRNEMDQLAEIAKQFADGKTGGTRLIREVERLHNSRHESVEGKFEVDRVIRKAIDDLTAMHRADRKSLMPDPKPDGGQGSPTPKTEGGPAGPALGTPATVVPAKAAGHATVPVSAPTTAARPGPFHAEPSAGGRDLSKHVADNEPQVVRQFGAGRVSRTELVQVGNRRAVRKTFENNTYAPASQQADAENLAARLAEAVGLPAAPAVFQSGDGEVFMDYRDGVHASDSPFLAAQQTGSEQGKQIALLDAIMANSDRHGENWIIGDDGSLVPIDHAYSFEFPDVDPTAPHRRNLTDAFAYHLFSAGDGDGKWRSHVDYSRGNLREIRDRVVGLRAEFEILGRTNWYNAVLARLDHIASLAQNP